MTTLEESYARCAALSRAQGPVHYTATLLLPRVKRHHVQALFGFGRYAAEMVRGLKGAPVAEQVQALADLEARFFEDLVRADSRDLVLKAVVHTVIAFDINPDYFRRFLRSMSSDLTVTTYETFDDLLDYLDGAAAAVGEMVLPILEPVSAEAYTYARDLGIAMRLTNILRNVSLDLDRGHVYLPQEDLRRFGAEPWTRHVTPEWRALMAFEVRRTREYYASVDQGIPLLPPSSARSVRAARRLAVELLDRVERAGGDVFSTRPTVPVARRVITVGQNVLRRRAG